MVFATTSLLAQPPAVVGHAALRTQRVRPAVVRAAVRRVTAAATANREDLSAAKDDSFINKLSVTLTNSPINKGKLWLAKKQAGKYDASEVQAEMAALIKDNDIMMFSFSTCPFCKKAKAALDEAGYKYTAIEVNEMGKEGLAYRAELGELTGRTSMPNIFIGGTNIGGCNDGNPGLLPLMAAGELDALLPKKKAAGLKLDLPVPKINLEQLFKLQMPVKFSTKRGKASSPAATTAPPAPTAPSEVKAQDPEYFI